MVLVWGSTVVRGRQDSDERLLRGRQSLPQPVEAVALAGHGHDQTRLLGIGLYLAPQLANQHVDAAVERLGTAVGEGVVESRG